MCIKPNQDQENLEVLKLNKSISQTIREKDKKFQQTTTTFTTIIPTNNSKTNFLPKQHSLIGNKSGNVPKVLAQSRNMSSSSSTSSSLRNRLKEERSPYLLQHATNPVHWYPWGEDAFKAYNLETNLGRSNNETKRVI